MQPGSTCRASIGEHVATDDVGTRGAATLGAEGEGGPCS
jgi:hypothetical protein